MSDFTVRLAEMDDAPELRALIEASVRHLQGDPAQSKGYTAAQIEGALGTALGLDTQLIADRHYFVATAPNGKIVASGGWSDRRTLFGSDGAAVREDDRIDPAVDAAKIRAIFVHPDWSRKGLGTLVLKTVERAALNAGFQRFEMGSTLTGVALYTLKGYRPGEMVQVPLPNGERLPILKMSKDAAVS